MARLNRSAWFLMAVVLAIAVCAVLGGCAPQEASPVGNATTIDGLSAWGVQRFVDEEAGVLCYLAYGRAISCVPLSATTLGVGDGAATDTKD